jgi:hypothetical protein
MSTSSMTMKRLPADLERDGSQVLGRSGGDLLAGARGTGQRDELVIGLRTCAFPSVPPALVSTLTTPGGRPASSKLASANAESGVVELGFTTMVLPP